MLVQAGLFRPVAREVLVQLRLERICRLNAFRCGGAWQDYALRGAEGAAADEAAAARDGGAERFGLFPGAALFNHSCRPSVAKVLSARPATRSSRSLSGGRS